MEITTEYLDKKFEDLHGFLRKNMLTKAELQSLRDEMPTKETIDQLTTAVDRLAKQTKDYNDEVKALQHQVDTMKEWIMEASQKLGIEYKA